MFRGKSGLLLTILLVGLAVALAPGCSKYDQQERNVQYVSNDLVRKDAEITWRQVNEAHAAWIKAGASHDKADPAFIVYEDAYARYAVSYNELWDRQDKPSFAGRLRAATDALPPPPPGMAVPLAAPKAEPATPTTPGGDLPGPAGRTLTDPAKPTKPTKSAKPAPEAGLTAPVAAPVAPPTKAAKTAAAAVVAAGPGSYLVQPGDTLASIAKRHGLSEKRLMDANGITDPRKLAAGKPLTIPAP